MREESREPFMITEDVLERNVALVRAKMLDQLEASLKRGAHYIDQELNGPQNFLLRPIIKSFYNMFARPDIDSGSRENLEICIKAGKEAVSNPNVPLDDIVEKYFRSYLKNDQTAKYCSKSHRNYRWFVDNTKNTFKAQIHNLIPVLQCEKENIETYDDLVIETYKNSDNAKRIFLEQVDYMEKGIQKIKSDPNILSVPAGKNIIIRVLVRGMKDTKRELLEDIERVFP